MGWICITGLILVTYEIWWIYEERQRESGDPDLADGDESELNEA